VKAVVVEDGEVVVAERPDPRPAGDEMLVAVRAAGLNGADIAQAAGRYPPPPGAPAEILGLELAGEVVEVGERIRRFQVGDRIMALVTGGAQAELAVVHELEAMPMPSRLDWAHAGAFPEVFATAHDALFGTGKLKLGERVLVHGGAGGVGTAAIQLAVSAGARVVATVRREALRAAVAALGAVAIGHGDLAAHGPYDLIIETIGGEQVGWDLDALAECGRIVVLSTSAGGSLALDLRLLMSKRASLVGSVLRPRRLEERAMVLRRLEAEVLPLVEENQIRIPVFATFDLKDAPAAYSSFKAGGKLGKIVLRMP
jgi:NADPH2:quinone reductase